MYVCMYVCMYHLLLLLVLAGLLTQHFPEELLEFLQVHLLVLEQEKTKWFLYKRVAWCLKHGDSFSATGSKQKGRYSKNPYLLKIIIQNNI